MFRSVYVIVRIGSHLQLVTRPEEQHGDSWPITCNTRINLSTLAVCFTLFGRVKQKSKKASTLVIKDKLLNNIFLRVVRRMPQEVPVK